MCHQFEAKKYGVYICVTLRRRFERLESVTILSLCYNVFMTLKRDLIDYKSRWLEVEKFVRQERRSASYELRWKQLNSAYAMAKGLGLLQPDNSERKVFQTWADLKEKATNQKRKE